jgi:starvation-inducible DNA-binding protein
MTNIGTPAIGTEQRDEVAGHLQALVVDLVALSLNGKQAHWHVTGRHFVPVHEQLDAIVDEARNYADLAAERAITLGASIDARPRAVAEASDVDDLPDGWLGDDKVVQLVANQLTGIVERARTHLDRIGELDVVTQDLVIEILRGLEKHLWMLQAQTA